MGRITVLVLRVPVLQGYVEVFAGLSEDDLGKPGESKVRKAVSTYSLPPGFRAFYEKN